MTLISLMLANMLLMRLKCYLARVLSSARLVSPYKLLLPMLNLSGHGLELLLKACIYLNGSVPLNLVQRGTT